MTKYNFFLLVAVFCVWVWAAINPTYRDAWLLENYLVFISVPLIILAGRYFRLSDVSYTLIAIYISLHIIGSHYTYAEVPFGYTIEHWFGLQRNMYDRLVHFSFGFLLYYPFREVFKRLAKVKGFWAYYFPLDIVLAFSAVYEIFEWYIVRNADPAAGLAFLGSQGDAWDSQKDMLMAGIGALVAMIIIFSLNWIFNKDHWKEFKDSFKIPKDDKPLGEEKFKEYLEGVSKSCFY